MTFDWFTIFVVVGATLVICVIIRDAIRSFFEWRRNNTLPIEFFEVRVVSKRKEDVGHVGFRTIWKYYILFEFVSSNEALEIPLPRRDRYLFDVVIEGERGSLSMQGTRYISYSRQ